MRLLIQRVKEAHVEVNNKISGKIGKGLLVFVGIRQGDHADHAKWLAKKLVGLRIFEDAAGKMNCGLEESGGALLIVSQFTLYANCTRGRRPDFLEALGGKEAEALYEVFLKEVRAHVGHVETGEFGADMQVHLINDGPATFLIDR